MAYLNKIDINGRTYYLQHLTDGKNEAKLPALEKNSTLIVQDYNSYSGNVGDSDTPVYIENNKVKPLSSNIGGEAQFVYMKRGSITASTSTVGSNTNPVYMKDGVITEFEDTIGSDTQPVYIKAGDVTASNSTVGSGITPIYMQDGVITASNKTIGTNINPVYMNKGAITKSDATVGSDIKPIYLDSGVITVSNGNVGSETIPVYMANGTITQTTETVGSGIKPIYMNSGAITASTSTVGATNQPIYMKNGEITVCSDSVGGAGVPVYMLNGVITACNTIPISSGGTNAATAKEALQNFGLTATADELNTLDGITATVTELNYVDGVTSSIQEQFNNHDGRIETMEAFFKEAEIDASKEFIDTLKEIQTYISEDKTGAASMALAIKENKDAITVLNGSAEGSVAKAVADAKTVLDGEIAKKVDKVDGKGLSTNDYTDDEKSKLAGIESGANNYTHPTRDVIASGFYKIAFDELGHVSSVVSVSKEDIVGLGIPAQDTIYEVAVAMTETESGVDGLLSASDKAKYDQYEATIAGLQQQIIDLKKLVEGYHPVTEPDPEPEPEPEQ